MIKCILQARMGSTRLPGKVMMPLGDQPMLAHVCQRISRSVLIDEMIVATTDQAEDDIIFNWCEKANIQVFRGSEWDVLSRYYGAATKSGTPEAVVRICCDSPTHHGEVVDFTIREFKKFGTDYFSNGNQGPYFFEDGLTSEIFSFDALEKAFLHAQLLSEREHVTPYIKNSGRFSCAWRKFTHEKGFKLSVDTSDDMEIANRIFLELGPDFDVATMFDWIRRKPDIHERIFSKEINSGYIKSLSEDRKVK